MASLKNVHLATEGEDNIYEGYDDFQLDVSYCVRNRVIIIIVILTGFGRGPRVSKGYCRYSTGKK